MPLTYSGTFSGAGGAVSGQLSASLSVAVGNILSGTWTYSGQASYVLEDGEAVQESVSGDGRISGTPGNLTMTVDSGYLFALGASMSADGGILSLIASVPVPEEVAVPDVGAVEVTGQMSTLPPVVQFQLASTSVDETRDASLLYPLTLTRSFNAADVATTVHVSSSETLSATPGVDFEPIEQDIAFDQGETSKTVALRVIPDVAPENNELITVRVTAVTFGSIGATPTIQVTILDDDTAAPQTVTGGSGNDNLQGGAGDDTVSGGAGDDIADAGAGNDNLSGEDGADTLTGGDGDDVVDGGTGNDDLDGGAGADTLTGDDGADTLDGGEGNDDLTGGPGDDTLEGGAGTDVAEYSSSRSAYTITRTATGYTVSGPDGTDTLTGIEQLQFGNQTMNLTRLASTSDSNVTGAYFAMFGRAPEPSGFQYWEGQLGTTFASLGAMIDNWLTLDIVKANGYPDGQSATEFIRAIYLNVFNKEPDDNGYWASLIPGRGRGTVVADMLVAANGVPAGTAGKDYIDNKISGATLLVNLQYAYGSDMSLADLTTLLNEVTAGSGTVTAAADQTVQLLGTTYAVAGLAGTSTFTDTWLT